MSTIGPCPECGSKFEMQVGAGIDGQGTGRRYHCGTIYWLEQNKVTVRGVSCELIRNLKGAAKADEERLIAAAERAGIPFMGCDTPEHLADRVIDLEGELETVEKRVLTLCSDHSFYEQVPNECLPCAIEDAEGRLDALEAVQRYAFRNGDPHERFEAWMPEDDSGEWVKWSDIADILERQNGQ